MRRAACLLVAAVALPTSAASARWHATDLGTIGGGFSRATAINERGQVVGSAVPSGARTSTHHCFLWAHGVMRDLGAPAGTHDCRPVAIDDAGEIAGTSGGRAFLWRNGRFLDLGPGEAVALDAAGDVVLGRGPHSLVWTAGRTIRL
jgi:probable HAF family extracellular repeat protein